MHLERRYGLASSQCRTYERLLSHTSKVSCLDTVNTCAPVTDDIAFLVISMIKVSFILLLYCHLSSKQTDLRSDLLTER